jgi:type I restriction enzyme, S subunit
MSLPQYMRYKPSNINWIGGLPEHWATRQLKHIAKLTTGITPPTEDEESYAETGFPWIRPEDIDESGKPSNASRFLSDTGASLVRKLRPGASLVCCIGTIGKVGIVKVGCSTNQQITAVEFEGNALYFNYTLQAARPELENRATGNVLKILNSERLGSIRVPVPEPDEATCVSRFLADETAKIDALVEDQRRLIELLKEKRQAVISHAVTKGLNPDALMKPSGSEWLGDIPATWRMKQLKHISPVITVGIVVNPSNYVSDEGLPFIYGGDIQEGKINWETARRIELRASVTNNKTLLRAGDLLTVRVGAPGITAVVPPECEGGNCASVMLVRKGAFDSQWLCYVMNAPVIRYQVEVVQYGAAQEQFNISHAVNFRCPVPSPDEQIKIASFLDDETGKLDTLIEAASHSIDLLQERRSALISAAVTGKIDVRNAVPECVA